MISIALAVDIPPMLKIARVAEVFCTFTQIQVETHNFQTNKKQYYFAMSGRMEASCTECCVNGSTGDGKIGFIRLEEVPQIGWTVAGVVDFYPE